MANGWTGWIHLMARVAYGLKVKPYIIYVWVQAQAAQAYGYR